eukprot:CAMPEP_0177554516 /NCGR_PEP_ID=MMETSP0369-20130122/68015_1 /TAXON_ID=447022 ORGANISM="Scrippsiella hangoei-like, Strain SHHI-4" /NCGR_SAMPLE_ID=MMETSP0369 /ASSEMBLY_ACC=CAM_ASM_000364 /LENGTH=42 /DNA_ID= /DNA_START= /DNA_END= /DNA_ORIENTATION=
MAKEKAAATARDNCMKTMVKPFSRYDGVKKSQAEMVNPSGAK